GAIPAPDEAIHVTGLAKSHGKVRAVDGMTLTVARGEVVALLGPNGAGKSTTIDMLLGLTTPDAGEVRIFGRPVREAVTTGDVGAMLQSGALLEDATVAETVGVLASMYARPLLTATALERAGITDLANRRGRKLSGGQKQRVHFAMALVADPDLLVLDEPTAAMDVESRRAFWASMREFTASGRTVLFATHYLAEAEEFADRVILMRSGRIVADGSVAQIRAAVSGRMLRAVVPGATRERLAALPGVTSAELRGDRAELSCADSDTAMRALLAAFPQATDIEITAHGLEEAFVALTQDAGEDTPS
ncbi:ABC transporter ATP-binding protein, partial [Streptomyces sp. NPDC001130]